MPSVWVHSKVQGLGDSMGEALGCPISQAVRAGKHGSLILMIWQPEGVGTMRNIYIHCCPKCWSQLVIMCLVSLVQKRI